MSLVDKKIRVAFVVGDYPPVERKRREDTALAYSSPEVEVPAGLPFVGENTVSLPDESVYP